MSLNNRLTCNVLRVLALSTFLMRASAPAQVLASEEIRDPAMRELQKRYFTDLKHFTEAAAAHSFPFRFYFSRILDLTEKEQQTNDQRAVQFDRYRGATVLKVTGNYFAAYSAEMLKPGDRARQTYQDVILPLLRAAAPALGNVDAFESFAFEISHHVRTKVLGVPSESTENVVLILPRNSALRLVATTEPMAQQAALREGEVFLNAAPITLWPQPEGNLASEPVQVSSLTPGTNSFPAKVPATKQEPASKLQDSAIASARTTSPEALKGLQHSWQSNLDRMAQELNSQAHFVRYAPPAFIPFHKGLYLQLSLTTALAASAAGSQYKLAAMAFDQHIAHLIRPVLAYLKEDHGDLDGIDFSTTVRLGNEHGIEGSDSDGSQVAVEFIFPLTRLRDYEQFDCTGQQLVDSGFVLINGERVGLNLQNAESDR